MAAPKRSLRELWNIYSKGDPLTDSELVRLIKSAEKGEEYLQARGEHLALKATRFDLAQLRSYRESRRTFS